MLLWLWYENTSLTYQLLVLTTLLQTKAFFFPPGLQARAGAFGETT